ncbi:hypothetical protein [Gluconobacter japonicus]|uniref:hypothetical protein n=1 Tax=Gluconobacter japonicus TaxID=376620 RepID=UPI0005560392|nr:hypothetical protein [Gluconobacter japonicus]MBS1051891.1 hypothetical protein [Gluconobacter japonicus]
MNREFASLAVEGNVPYINPQISQPLTQGDADGFVVMLIWFWRSGIRLHGSFLKNEVTSLTGLNGWQMVMMLAEVS